MSCVQAEAAPVAPVVEPEVAAAEPVTPDTMAEDFVVTESAVAVEAAMSVPAEEPVSSDFTSMSHTCVYV